MHMGCEGSLSASGCEKASGLHRRVGPGDGMLNGRKQYHHVW